MRENYKRLLKVNLVGLLALLLSVLSGGFLVNIQDAGATGNTDGIDEIVVIDANGYVVVYNYEGVEVYRSPEGGWSYITTGDLNGDGDHEIVAVSALSNRIKVYDPQIVNNTMYTFETTYTGSSGTFKKVGVGNLIGNDDQLEIAVLRGIDTTHSRMIIYTPPNTNPALPDNKQKYDLTNWDDFAIGDYDGDGDDDFAYTYWNNGYPDGSKSWFQIFKGHDPLTKIDADAQILNNSQWFDIAAGNFNSGSKMAWIGSQNLSPNTAAQEWDTSGSNIDNIWKINEKFNHIATADFRNAGIDQAALLRTADGVLKFATKSGGTGVVWSSASGLGTNWLNLAAGNLDNESTYKEAVIVKSNLMRIYLIAQSPSEFLDCVPHSPNNREECKEISGSFNGQIAVGDLGTDFTLPPKPEPYQVSPSAIVHTVAQSQTLPDRDFYVRGQETITAPINWKAAVLPDVAALSLKKIIARDPELSLTITSQGVNYYSSQGSGQLSSVPWLRLSAITGTTPSTVTAYFSDTFSTSPLFEPDLYQATILIYRHGDSPEARYRYVDAIIIVAGSNIYLPIIIK